MSETRFGNVYYGLVVDAYELFHPEGNIADAEFYAELIRERPARALELMCGSGRVLVPLLRQGIVIDGTDSSSEMLARCKSNALAEGLKPELYEQYVHELSLPNRYSTIVLAYSSFALLIDRSKHSNHFVVFMLIWTITDSFCWTWQFPGFKLASYLVLGICPVKVFCPMEGRFKSTAHQPSNT